MYRAALDPALNCAALAVLDDSGVLLRAEVPMAGREGARLPLFVAEELGRLGLTLDDIALWSIGSGPGSFTGLRLAAALAAGWCFARPGVKSRGVPSAFALAAGLPGPVEPGATVGCLYDGRNRELLYYQVRRNADGWESTGVTAVLNREAAAEFFRSRPLETLAVYAGETAAVLPLLPEGVTPGVVSQPRTEVLALDPAPEYDNDLTRLIYIRPAVYPV